METTWKIQNVTARGGIEFTAIVHPWPHIEEVFAILLIIEEADKGFFDRYGRNLRLGTDGGPFDEHPRDGQPGKRGECCATLVAKALNVTTQDLVWGQLLRYVRFTDTGMPMQRDKPRAEEASHPFDLNSLLKMKWRRIKDEKNGKQSSQADAEPVIEVIFDHLRDFLWAQRKLQEARQEIKDHGRQFQVAGPDGRGIKVVMVTTDNPQFNAAARFFFQAGLIVMRTSTGHVRIFTDERRRLDLRDLAQAIHVEEMTLRGERVPEWKTLREPGIPAGSCWYYHVFEDKPGVQQLLNGSEQHEQAPTMIPLERIEELIRVVFDEAFFDEEHADQCGRGRCDGAHETCSLYRLGLPRCRKIRYEMKVNQR